MFVQTSRISDTAIKNILSVPHARFTYMDDSVLRIKGTGELYYIQITENGVFAGYIKDDK
jgi:hypothetical protein